MRITTTTTTTNTTPFSRSVYNKRKMKKKEILNVKWALDCQKPWSNLLVNGEKRIETRYNTLYFIVQFISFVQFTKPQSQIVRFTTEVN